MPVPGVKLQLPALGGSGDDAIDKIFGAQYHGVLVRAVYHYLVTDNGDHVLRRAVLTRGVERLCGLRTVRGADEYLIRRIVGSSIRREPVLLNGGVGVEGVKRAPHLYGCGAQTCRRLFRTHNLVRGKIERDLFGFLRVVRLIAGKKREEKYCGKQSRNKISFLHLYILFLSVVFLRIRRE